MKRKLWGIALALCLALGLMTSALATEVLLPSSPTEVTEVSTAEELGTALNNSSSIKLTASITGSINVSREVTLDLNGYTLTNTAGSHTITVKEGGNLTIKDSSADKTGTVDNVSHGKAALYNEGTVTIQGGTFSRSAEASTSKSDGGGNSWYTVKNMGTMTINDGTFMFSKDNNGEFSSLVVNGVKSNGKGSQLTINGGTFKTNFIAVKNEYGEGNKLTITDGAISGQTSEAATTGQAVQNWGGTAEITGGTFTGRVTTWAFIPETNETLVGIQQAGKTVISGESTKIDGDVESIQYKANIDASEPTVAAKTEIKGGTITGNVFSDVRNYAGGASPTTPGQIEITGGTFANATLSLTMTPAEGPYYVGDEITLKADDPGAGGNDTTWAVLSGSAENKSEGSGLERKYKLTQAGTVTIKATRGSAFAYKTIQVVKKTGTGTASLQSWTYGDSGAHKVGTTPAEGQADADSFVYYDNNGTELDAQPTKAGKYSLKVTWPANDIYNEQTETVYFNIEPKALTVTVTAKDKDYDGTTTAELGTDATLEGVVDPDQVTLDSTKAKAEFVDAKAGKNKTVNVSGYALNGKDAANYTVTQPTATATINEVAATGITLNKTKLSLYVTRSETLVATLTPAITSETVTWSSSNEKIATVDQNGKVTAVAAGTAYIYASINAEQTQCLVTVSPLVPATAIKLDKADLTLKVNDKTQLKATLTPANTTDDLVWTTSNKNVATVSDQGLVTGVRYGTATITAKANDKVVATCTVYVVCGTDKCKDYPDVDATEWYHSAVDYVTAKGIMQGHDTGDFAPEGKLTRAELAQILYNYEKEVVNEGKEPELGTIKTDFTDLEKDGWYLTAVKWAASNGIVEGDGEDEGNTFRPNDPVNREEIVTMLHRYMVEYLKRTDFTDAGADWTKFPDYKDVSEWAEDAFEWAVKYGIVDGDDGSLKPQNTATRAQAAKVVMVAVNY